MLILLREHERTIVQLYKYYSTLHVYNYRRLQLCLRWLFSIQGMDLKLFPPRTITKSSNKSLVIIKLQQRHFWCAGNPLRLFHTSIWSEDLKIVSDLQKLCKNCCTSKFT